MSRRRPAQALALLLVLAAGACRDKEGAPAGATTGASATTVAPAARAAVHASPAPARYDLLSHLQSCEVEHLGLLLDMGTKGAAARRRFSAAASDQRVAVDREGASFEGVSSRELSLDVWLDAPIQKPMLSLRVHGGSARLLHLSIDEQRLGVLRLPVEETRILASNAGTTALAAGRHRIALRLSGAPRASKTPLLELDWVRLSEADPRPQSYAAPTQEDIVADIALTRVPKRSLALRAPSRLRCWLRPSADARLRVSVGLWGSGKGIAELRLLRDAEAPVVLQTQKVTGGDSAVWTPLSLDLGPYAGSLVAVELAAPEATAGARVAFGDPALVRSDETPMEAPRAQVVVLVVLAAADRRRLPPWGPTGALRTLGELTRSGVSFGAHRAPTTVVPAVMATLLTGFSPRAHGLEDASSRLAPELHTLPEIIKEASGRTAFFSGVPTSFAPLGFNQGWDVSENVSPVKDLPATEPLLRAARWLEQEVDPERAAPVFVVVHARGGHPPWDLSREEAQQLKPAEYAGILDPRRGGMLIHALRERRRRGARRLQDEDWTRLRALSDGALAKQDVALGQLIAVLKRKEVWERTLFIVTSDVAPGDPPDLPYDPVAPLTEERLLIPLLVKLPGNLLAGKEVQAPSSVEDLPVSVLAALGLPPPEQLSGIELHARALGREPLGGAAQTATLPNRYATRLGQWLLRGELGRVPTLCALDVDPACANDVFERQSIAARALWHATFAHEDHARALTPPEASRRPLVLDDETAAALTVWGEQR